jgi:2,4-diketo-3-deoxy-L-fuconate hydrolase
MKLVRFTDDEGEVHPGVLQDDVIVDLTETGRTAKETGSGFGTVLETIARRGPSAVAEVVDGASDEATVSRSNVNLTYPVAERGRLISLGGAYTEHLQERGQKISAVPSQWIVPETALVGPDDPILLPERVSDFTMPAVELGLVVGKGGHYIGEADAMSHVVGYTVVNDVTARTEWPGPMAYKLMDTFSPCGPYLTTADSVSSPTDLEMTLHMGGKKICHGSTAGMRFSLQFIIRFISSILELRPGDVIATGDPGRVQEGLEVGGDVTATIDEVGEITNKVREI